MSLVPDRWKREGLHNAVTAPRGLRAMWGGTFAGIFDAMTWREIFQVELLYRLRHLAKGKPSSALVHVMHGRFVRNKPAMWLRRVFVSDHPLAS
jgi:hypothetical protein